MAGAFNEIIKTDVEQLCEINSDYIHTCLEEANNTVWGSGIVQNTPRAEAFVASCAFKQERKFWMPPQWTDAGGYHCSVEEEEGCDCEGLSMGTENVFKIGEVKCFGQNDCEAVCAGTSNQSPLDVIQNELVGPFMIGQRVKKLLAMNTTIAQVLQASKDESYQALVLDECTEPKPIDECTFIDANCMTDCGQWDGLLMHKDLFVKARKRGYVECYCDETGEGFRTTDGIRVIPVAGAYADMYMKDQNGCYLSTFFMNGVFEYAEMRLPNEVEPYRDPKANNCSGASAVYYRNAYTMSPIGMNLDCDAFDNGKNIFVPYQGLITPEAWTPAAPAENFGLGFTLNQCV